jgi:hypothetical protein
VKILFLPEEFSELLHLRSKLSFAPYTETIRAGENLVIRVGLEDFTEDDVLVAISKESLVILGSRPPASFCMHLFIPSDALLKEIEARIEERVLLITVPLRKPES